LAWYFIVCARAHGTLEHILTEHETGNVSLVSKQG
jgi:hypothetical protein